MTRAATQAEINDHRYDLRKHDTDPIPHRLDKPLTTAMDIVLIVRGMKNPQEAAKLVEQYAQTFAVAVPLDRRFALAKLVGYCEGVIKSGILGTEELRLRSIVADVLAAFDMPSKVEREGPDA